MEEWKKGITSFSMKLYLRLQILYYLKERVDMKH